MAAYDDSKYIIVPAIKMADDLDKFIIYCDGHCDSPIGRWNCLICGEIEACIVPENDLYNDKIVAINNLRYMNSKGNNGDCYDFIFNKELIKAYTREAGGLLYLGYALVGCTNDCQELEVKDGTEVVLIKGIEDSNIEHLIIPDSFRQFWGDKQSILDGDDLTNKCKKLKKITYKGNDDGVINEIISDIKNSKIELYLQKSKYKEFHRKYSDIIRCDIAE